MRRVWSKGTSALLLGLAAATHAAAAQDAESDSASSGGAFAIRGSIGVEARTFTVRPSYPLQNRELVQTSLVASAKASWTSNDKAVVVDIAPFLRLDETDADRSHWDLREAAVSLYGRYIDVRVGIGKVFWGVTESRKLVDIVNQTDLVEEIEGDEKLGQPMVMLRGHVDSAEAAVFILPAFRERTFPGAKGRLRPWLPINRVLAQYESDAHDRHLDVAGRLKGRIDDFDIGLSYFSGTSREPRFEIGGSSLIPVYDVIDQAGLDVQATLGPTLLKLEAITRDGHQGADARRFSAVVAGVEHTLSQPFDTAWDLGLILEFTWDDRPSSAPPTIYNKDLFVGARLAFNDADDSSALVGALFDADNGSIYATIEASSRIDDVLRFEIEGAFILRADDLDFVLHQMRDDSHIVFRLLRFF